MTASVKPDDRVAPQIMCDNCHTVRVGLSVPRTHAGHALDGLRESLANVGWQSFTLAGNVIVLDYCPACSDAKIV